VLLNACLAVLFIHKSKGFDVGDGLRENLVLWHMPGYGIGFSPVMEIGESLSSPIRVQNSERREMVS
jgi:hypothetical protein